MRKLNNLIRDAFLSDTRAHGLFWRTSRNDTFVDLLMLLAHKSEHEGMNEEICVEFILSSFKAMVNNYFGQADYTTEYSELKAKLESELLEVEFYLRDRISSAMVSGNSLSLSPDSAAGYFKVLNNLNLKNFAPIIFEDAFSFFINYLSDNYLTSSDL